MVPRRKSITVFKAGGHWIFKHFFDDSEIFRELTDYYNKDLYRFEFKTVGERNKALKLLEKRGFEMELVEDLRSYAVKLPRYSKYAPVLKNSVAMIEAPEWRSLPDGHYAPYRPLASGGFIYCGFRLIIFNLPEVYHTGKNMCSIWCFDQCLLFRADCSAHPCFCPI